MRTMKVCAAGMAGVLLLAGCGQKAATPASEPTPATTATSPTKEAALSPEQLRLMGLQTQTLTAAPLERVSTGQANVLAHDALAQSQADLQSAQAASLQSTAALKRLEGLASTPGALGDDAVEAARRQAHVDTVQVQLARRRLQAQFGDLATQVPGDLLEALADGRAKLLRVVFADSPVGNLPASAIRFVALDAAQGAREWSAQRVWSAPAEAGVPGRSLFAVVEDAGLAEGTRLLATLRLRGTASGVGVPSAAVVTHDGRLWCYVQSGEGQFERRGVDTEHPVADGYAVAEGFKVGEQVVVRGAGLLLAREFGETEGAP
jgi:hypothetical protein